MTVTLRPPEDGADAAGVEDAGVEDAGGLDDSAGDCVAVAGVALDWPEPDDAAGEPDGSIDAITSPMLANSSDPTLISASVPDAGDGI